MPTFNLEQNLLDYCDHDKYKKRYDVEKVLRYCKEHNRKISELNEIEIGWFTINKN